MNTKGKNKNASHLTHEMKKEHGGLVEASKKADKQPILEIIKREVGAVIHAKNKVIVAQKNNYSSYGRRKSSYRKIERIGTPVGKHATIA